MISLEKAIPEVPCPRCYLLTPAWRKHCIHCGRPQPAPSDDRNRSPKASAITQPVAGEAGLLDHRPEN